MTLKQLEDFRGQIQRQIDQQIPAAGLDLLKHVGAIELLVGLNLVNQLITMEQAQLAAPPGPLAPEI